jgi:adenosylcobyric acid synthase
MAAVMQSWDRLCDAYEAVLVEGAGSPAEINLRDRDIANMGFAEAADVPVMLVADIDRGGVFAHLVGTLDLLSPSEQARVKGFVINRFRGDIGLLQSGLDWLEARTGRPVLGVLPYLHGLFLDAEDALADSAADVRAGEARAARDRAGVLAHLQPHRPRPAAPAPAGGFPLDRPRAGDPACRPDRAARLQERAGRPRLAARAGLGDGDPPPPALRRQGDRHLRRLPDARPRAADPLGLEGAPGTMAGLGLLDWRRCSPGRGWTRRRWKDPGRSTSPLAAKPISTVSPTRSRPMSIWHPCSPRIASEVLRDPHE